MLAKSLSTMQKMFIASRSIKGTIKPTIFNSRVNAIINRLEKTKVERFPDLQQEKIAYLKMTRKEARDLENKIVTIRIESLINRKQKELKNTLQSRKKRKRDHTRWTQGI